jgi:hypothetical protein
MSPYLELRVALAEAKNQAKQAKVEPLLFVTESEHDVCPTQPVPVKPKKLLSPAWACATPPY